MSNAVASQEISVKLPDGSVRQVPRGTTPLDIAKSISPRLADAALAAQVRASNNGNEAKTVELSRPLEEDVELRLLTEKDPESLEVFRHSSAHVLATAVTELFPETKLGHGPPTESGFFYDFYRPTPFTPDDLAKIEERMAEVVKRDEPFVREMVDRDKALAQYKAEGDWMKEHFIGKHTEGSNQVSFYRNGKFVDFCRGPHVPSTGRVAAFRLTSLAGAYWRGDARNAQLQRIYGTAWANEKDLKAYLDRVEEAKQRDHRRIGQALDLFSLHPIAPGSPFFHPKGAVVYNLLVQFIRSLYARYGYTEVITPLVYKTELYRTSGHYDLFKDDMFLMSIEEEEYGVKPMNCPGHCYLYATRKHSYRDLPIRYADFSRLHRFEPSGTLAGLTRVRSMAQDDAHIFCTPEQLDDELERFIAMTKEVYGAFGFERVEVTLQTRPEKFLGRVELWDAAEAALQRAAERAGYPVVPLPGQGAFYGPKIGFDFRDVLERSWTLATVQIDCAMPERFGLGYVAADGHEATPVMIHRAVLGSIERFIAILLEHTAGKLPLWLAPIQVRVLPVSEKVAEYAARVDNACRAAGLRAEADLRNEKLGYKVREAQLEKIPLIVVVGEREAASGLVAPRGESEPLALDAFVARTVDVARLPGGVA